MASCKSPMAKKVAMESAIICRCLPFIKIDLFSVSPDPGGAGLVAEGFNSLDDAGPAGYRPRLRGEEHQETAKPHGSSLGSIGPQSIRLARISLICTGRGSPPCTRNSWKRSRLPPDRPYLRNTYRLRYSAHFLGC